MVLVLIQALWVTVALGTDPDTLIEKLSSRDASERREAVNQLGRLKDTQFISPLIQALKDEEPMIRLEASGALMDIGMPVSEPLLEALQKEKSPAFLWNAIRILEFLGDTAAIDSLKEIADGNPDPNIEQAARYTIERLERIKTSQKPQ